MQGAERGGGPRQPACLRKAKAAGALEPEDGREVPAGGASVLLVRRPMEGRWVAAED